MGLLLPGLSRSVRSYGTAAAAWLLLTVCVQAASISSNGTGGGNWGTGGSWAGGNIPATGDVVTILASDQINMNANSTCAGLTVIGTLNFGTNNRTLTVNGPVVLRNAAFLSGSGATRVLTASGSLTVNSGATARIAGITLSIGTTTTITGALTLTQTAGTKTLTGDITVNGTLDFTADATVVSSGKLIVGNGSIIGGGGGTGSITTASNLSVQTGITTTLTDLALTCGGNTNIVGTALLNGGTYTFGGFRIGGSGVVDASGGVNTISVSDAWNNVSSAADAFVEGTTSLVIFNGSSGTQTIDRTAGTETFDGLSIANTSATSPAIATSVNIQVNDDLDHTNGIFDLAGNTLTLTGSATAQVHTLSGGGLISSNSGAAFTVTDPSNVNRIQFADYRIGTNIRSIPINVTCGRISFTNFTEWGTAAFTKTKNTDDLFGGGNYYHGPVTFTADASASRWRMGDNLALPDTFVDATFNANALSGTNNNFIVGANSMGNAFYGTTTMLSTTSGGFFICRQNGAGTSSATFHGPVLARVALSGNITFADAAAGLLNSVTFMSTVQPASSATSTGDIYFGNGASATVTFAPTAQLIPGTLQGQTSIHFRHVTQNGTLPQQVLGISNSRIYCGGNAYPNTFNGPVTFKADTMQIAATRFNEKVDFEGLSHLTLAGSTFNGTPNVFLKRGTGDSSSNGGNSFIAGSLNTFTSTGAGYMRLGATQVDDMNGNVRYIQTGEGALAPAYGTACTYAGNISTSGTLVPIEFGTGAGSVVLDGIAQKLDGSSSTAPIFDRLTLAFSGTLIANIPLTVRKQLTMTSGRIDLSGYGLTLGTAAAAAGTLNYTSGWFENGPITRWFPTGAVTIGNAAGLFPLGATGNQYRPLWFGSTANLTAGGTLTVRHTPTASGITNVNFADANWGSTVTGVSNATWVLAAGNGFDINGTTGSLRFGGTGFNPFTLADLDACQTGGVVGNHAASTSANVPLEVNRRNLTTITLPQSWHIGTRNNAGSPLPIELISFTARPEGRHVQLEWATASEQDNALFTVERSADGISFTLLLSVDGAGDSQQQLQYQDTDEAPLQGTSYYRLKQTDTDGAFTYSDIVPVQFTQEEAGLRIHPTPCTDGPVTILLPTKVDGPQQLSIWDGTGRLMLERTIQGTDRIELSRESLASSGAGIYHVLIEGGSTRYRGTLLMQ